MCNICSDLNHFWRHSALFCREGCSGWVVGHENSPDGKSWEVSGSRCPHLAHRRVSLRSFLACAEKCIRCTVGWETPAGQMSPWWDWLLLPSLGSHQQGKKNGKEGKNPRPSSVHTAAIKVTQIPTITSWDIFATRVKTSSYSLETKLMNQAGHYLTVKKKKKATEAKKPLVNNSGMLWVDCVGFFSSTLHYLSP